MANEFTSSTDSAEIKKRILYSHLAMQQSRYNITITTHESLYHALSGGID